MVRYDKFDSISLPLPESKNPGLSLGHLLSEYVAVENLTDVTCESCNETCNHTKSLTFAKVNRIEMNSRPNRLLINAFSSSFRRVYVFTSHGTLGCPVVRFVKDKIMFTSPRVYQWLHTVLFSRA